jgi:hypothetical protein
VVQFSPYHYRLGATVLSCVECGKSAGYLGGGSQSPSKERVLGLKEQLAVWMPPAVCSHSCWVSLRAPLRPSTLLS